MDPPFVKIGSKISIISKANVRYEGVFIEIDTESLQIALSDVRFFGTEERAADVYIARQERIYPYVIFKSTDISDIRVMNNTDEKPQTAVPQVNGFARRDYPQSTLEFLRTFPLVQFDTPQSVLSTQKLASPPPRKFSSPRSIWTRCNHSSPYMWRIPRVTDFVGRSGDPNELPVDTNGDLLNENVFDHEYDFEKNNKLFEDLLSGIKKLDLSFESDDEQGKESAEITQVQQNNKEVQPDKIVPNISQGATPKKYDNYTSKSKSNATAYNKAKSFFDTVSCASIYRSPNSNPNWREWNKETFGIPMIRHQRRKRRTVVNAIKGIEDDGGKLSKNSEKLITDEKGNCDDKSEENVTVQKIRFQAVVVTKTRGLKSSAEGNKSIYEKSCMDESNAIEKDDVEKYSLKSYK